MPAILRADQPDFETRFQALLALKRESAPEVDDVVASILADVRLRGDEALIDYTSRFDRPSPTVSGRPTGSDRPRI